MNILIIILLGIILFGLYLLVSIREHFGGDEIAQNLENVVKTAFLKIPENLINALKGIGESLFSGLANLIKDETVKAAKIVAQETVKVAGVVKDEVEKDAKIVAEGTVKVANIVKDETVKFANETKTKFEDLGNNIKNGVLNVGGTIAGGFTSFGNSIKDAGKSVYCSIPGQCDNVNRDGTPNGDPREFTNGYNYCIKAMSNRTGYNECDATNRVGYSAVENWILDNQGKIKNTNFNKCLDSGGALTDCQTNNAGQQWTVLNVPGRGNMIVNSATGKCLDGGKNPPYLNTCDSDNNWMTQWQIGRFNSNLDDGWFRYTASDHYSDQIIPTSNVSEIKTQQQQRCLDISGGSRDNGAAIQLWGCHGGSNQKFVYNTANKTIQIIKSSKCLDLSNGNQNNGTKIQQWDCNGSDAQKWILDGPYIRMAANNNKCIDNSNIYNDGNQLKIWDCNGSDAQKFNSWF